MDKIVIAKFLKSPKKGKGKCRKCSKPCQWSKERVAMHVRNCEMSTDEEKIMFPTKTQCVLPTNSNMEILGNTSEYFFGFAIIL